jgi:3-oxoacyl-(acyl-carrier-protein) synthase
MRYEKQRRVVITGLGAIAPNGLGSDAFWRATVNGTSGITALDDHTNWGDEQAIRVAGSIPNFAVENYLERKLAHRTDRVTHFALAAVQEALSDAQLDLTQEQPQRVGAVIANTMGGMNYVLKQLQALYTRGPRAMSAYTAIAWLHVSTVGHTAIHYGLQGYCKTPLNDTVGGLDALGMAARAIKRGAADILITGGCESFLHPFILQVLKRQGQYVTGVQPDAYRPFDRRAAGLIVAEGAGVCILEELEHARQRGAPIYAELGGYAQTNDAHGLTVPGADGKRYAQAMRQAMSEAEITREQVAYVSLDGRAVPDSDRGEAQALQLAFGEEAASLPVSVPRTTIGHSYAAAGVLDSIIAIQALKHHMVPPTINCEATDPEYKVNLVRQAQQAFAADHEHRPNAVLIGGRAVGGANVVLAIKEFV